ncbi:hypothetical protein [Falsiroseomonas sp. CW058]|uniref:hypothetical protein n=1 Tax=Falsiroseomonas sp. CW058 TaxID=3388664 RepID=UPI003D32045C
MQPALICPPAECWWDGSLCLAARPLPAARTVPVWLSGEDDGQERGRDQLVDAAGPGAPERVVEIDGVEVEGDSDHAPTTEKTRDASLTDEGVNAVATRRRVPQDLCLDAFPLDAAERHPARLGHVGLAWS